jgi:hypothetical protein
VTKDKVVLLQISLINSPRQLVKKVTENQAFTLYMKVVQVLNKRLNFFFILL